MAPPPVDRNGGSSLPTPFLTKTYQLVDDKSVDDIVSWNDDGSAFVVWNPTDFAKDLLPKYFKHNNFSSFVRQLNTYGFRKVVPDRWEFSNDCFKRGEKSLLRDIQRRKVAAAPSTPAAVVQLSPPVTVSPSESGEEQVFSSSSDSPIPARDSAGGTAAAAGLIGENERLRKENNQLNKELNQMKKLCNNIYSLMSNYATPDKPANSPESVVRPLDLLPMPRFSGEESDSGAAGEVRSMAEEIGAKLFGVPIGTKRGRDQCGDVDLQLQQPGGEVKSEPSDLDNGEEDDDDWLNLRKVRNQRCV